MDKPTSDNLEIGILAHEILTKSKQTQQGATKLGLKLLTFDYHKIGQEKYF